MTHRLTLSPRRARVLRWCERNVDSDLVAVWSPEDKQTLAGLVMDGLAMPTGSRYQLTPDGAKALRSEAFRVTPTAWYAPGFPGVILTDQSGPVIDFPPGDPDL